MHLIVSCVSSLLERKSPGQEMMYTGPRHTHVCNRYIKISVWIPCPCLKEWNEGGKERGREEGEEGGGKGSHSYLFLLLLCQWHTVY